MKQIAMIRSGEEYLESLRGRNLTVYLAGNRVAEPLDHPMIRPHLFCLLNRVFNAHRQGIT